jgi:hypothetical protein
VFPPEFDELGGKPEKLLLLWRPLPVEPSELVVLAIGIIISFLSTRKLVTSV